MPLANLVNYLCDDFTCSHKLLVDKVLIKLHFNYITCMKRKYNYKRTIVRGNDVLAFMYKLPCPANDATSCSFHEKLLLTDGSFSFFITGITQR